MGVYVDEIGAANLRAYVYDGEDKSYYYRYVLTPMNKFLVEFIPIRMAPNLITLCGLFVSMSAFTVSTIYSPNFSETLPPWVCVFIACCLFIYQTLDNLDGRQARRTQSSSPLGMLFDHGIDALNCTIATLVQATVLQVGIGSKLFLSWSIAPPVFALATWEEYYTGKLTLPEINGPSDGILLCMLMCFLSAAMPGIWAQPITQVFPSLQGTLSSDWQMHWIVVISFLLLAPPTICANLYAVYKNNKVNKSLLRALPTMTPFVMHIALAIVWAWLSPERVFESQPRLFCWSMGFLFGNMACSLMLAHLSSRPFAVLRKVLLPLLVAVSVALMPLAGMKPLVSEFALLCFVGSCAFGCWLHLVINVINELTTILGIRCFVLRPQKKLE